MLAKHFLIFVLSLLFDQDLQKLSSCFTVCELHKTYNKDRCDIEEAICGGYVAPIENRSTSRNLTV